MISGVALVLLGVSIWIIFPPNRFATWNVPTDFSAVPASVHLEAPVLSLTDLQGVRHSLADYQGGVVLVNLWATWCPPCRAELPLLEQYFLRHQSQGFSVVAVEDGDPASDVQAFVRDYSLTFPVWLDPTYQSTDVVFKTRNLPSSYVLDRAGRVRLEWLGAISTANLEKYVTPILQE
jgi:cytochrome c biogenesis protein CcmG, thiol:disulfide interchange protein DsbE